MREGRAKEKGEYPEKSECFENLSIFVLEIFSSPFFSLQPCAVLIK